MSEKTNRYIDPLTDFGFKHLFGNMLNKEILIKFLAAVFEEKKQIADITYQPETTGERNEEGKKAFSELLCTEKNGKQFKVVIQRIEEDLFRKSTRDFMASFFNDLEADGSKQSGFPHKECYLLGLLNFSFGDCEDLYYREISFTKMDMKRNPHGKLGFKFLEIPEFSKSEEGLETETDKWFYLLSHLHELDSVPPCFGEEIFQQLFKAAELAGLTDEERETHAAQVKEVDRKDNRTLYHPEKAAEKAAEKEAAEGRLDSESKDFFIEVFKMGYELGFEQGMLEIANEINAKM
ncbi:PD-(D/E)XK nuclease family transposase [Pedobacter hartonius]|uniref:PD-(D/E)XK nuclease family transposase n=1 Tax=Pedobacter hartonius TaxID=425514 RepID=A0A1H4GGX5_9SPHI|nr:PD-(D/E)XK nuclease family transposase [Pedobacter hartonius]SEB08875.1 conserved hypothetical protein (putative transposase or invertase) [Pedobacter hartonius]